MITQYQTVGITYDESKIKLAAIFFDKVFCPFKTIKIPDEIALSFKIPQEILDFVKKSVTYDENALAIILDNFIKKQSIFDKNTIIEATNHTISETKTQFFNALILEIASHITNGKILGVPMFNNSILNYNFRTDAKQTKLFEKVEIEIINNLVIDCSALEWKQIVEVKKDIEFVEKVKRFSIFINKNYTGKNLSYITDDLNLQLHDYKNVCDKHGVKLTSETIKTLSNSKSLFGTFTLSILSMLADMPAYAITTATVGAVLELANIKINLKQYRDQYESSINKSPIAFIYDIEKLTKSNNA